MSLDDWCNNTDGRAKVLAENSVPVLLCSPQLHLGIECFTDLKGADVTKRDERLALRSFCRNLPGDTLVVTHYPYQFCSFISSSRKINVFKYVVIPFSTWFPVVVNQFLILLA
jgi:hypothetical protein